MNIDRRTAPEGAQAYIPQSAGYEAAWFKQDQAGDVYISLEDGDGKWIYHGRKDFPLGHILLRDSEACCGCKPPNHPGSCAEWNQWKGFGRPPTGTVCELRKTGGGWGKATIKYLSETICVWLWDNGNPDQVEHAEQPWNIEFRPVRTPEQIKAEERDKAINQMEFDTGYLDRGAFTKLYDAGWRKQVEP